MTGKFELNNIEETEIGKRVRSIIGVNKEFLTDDVILSPVFKTKTEKYINKAIKAYLEQLSDDTDFKLLGVAAMYYISYLLCVGMDARLPKQMENLSTKTLFQNTSWDEKALELLEKCDECIADFLDENDIEVENIYPTFADLSNEVEYPETNI